jgi:hypothetical protein
MTSEVAAKAVSELTGRLTAEYCCELYRLAHPGRLRWQSLGAPNACMTLHDCRRPRLHDLLRSTLVSRQRHFDTEYAAFAGHIANADLAAVRPYCFPSDRETQAKARSIAPAALANT